MKREQSSEVGVGDGVGCHGKTAGVSETIREHMHKINAKKRTKENLLSYYHRMMTLATDGGRTTTSGFLSCPCSRRAPRAFAVAERDKCNGRIACFLLLGRFSLSPKDAVRDLPSATGVVDVLTIWCLDTRLRGRRGDWFSLGVEEIGALIFGVAGKTFCCKG